jgi:hypothetical protein
VGTDNLNLNADNLNLSSVIVSFWYKDGELHRDGGFSAVSLCRNNVRVYEEIWISGKYNRSIKLKLPDVSELEIKRGVPHPRRPNRI